jgi:hypothetical protein
VDRKTMIQVLLPAGAAAAVVLLIGLLIALGDGSGSSAASGKGKAAAAGPPFPLDAAEWKPLGNEGLKVWDVKEGTGEPCPKMATVTIQYTGWLTDGTVFDSTKPDVSPRPVDGKPATFPLNRLVRGWQEGIPGMKPGGVRRLYVPYQLGYGERGSPPNIPPKADLLFEIEMVSFK